LIEKLPEFIGNNLFLVSLFIAVLVMLLWNLYSSALSGIKQLAPMEVTRFMNHEHAIVLDVRKEENYKEAHILNALNVPESDIESRKNELGKYKNKPVITYCETGTISARVAKILQAQGFEQTSCLKGGVAAWRNANLPLTKST